MNQPTEDRIKQIEERQADFDKRLKDVEQQQTEPIQVTVERRYPDKELLQEISRKQDELSRKQDEQFTHLKGELESISIKQNDHAKGLIMHSRSINALQEEMKEARADIASIKATLSDHGEMLKNTATKGDISVLKGDISALKATQDEQHTMLRQILRLLGQNPNE